MTKLAVLLAGLLAAAAQAQEHSDTPDKLPAGVGRDETFFACTACHGVAIIVSQGMSRERWDTTIDEMIRRNAMPEPDAADRRLIVDYPRGDVSATHAGPDEPVRHPPVAPSRLTASLCSKCATANAMK